MSFLQLGSMTKKGFTELILFLTSYAQILRVRIFIQIQFSKTVLV